MTIARALINSPKLLLADEPTGNLDTKTAHEIMETLASLNRERGVTIVLVTHESDIAAYADRIVTMRDGDIVADERVRKPIARFLPASVFGHMPQLYPRFRPKRIWHSDGWCSPPPLRRLDETKCARRSPCWACSLASPR